MDDSLYPKGHKLGMVVPVGGSNCAKCEYLSSGSNCRNKSFQRWNGGSKLPAPADRYCCDLFEAGDGEVRAKGRKLAVGRMVVVVVGGQHAGR